MSNTRAADVWWSKCWMTGSSVACVVVEWRMSDGRVVEDVPVKCWMSSGRVADEGVSSKGRAEDEW